MQGGKGDADKYEQSVGACKGEMEVQANMNRVQAHARGRDACKDE